MYEITHHRVKHSTRWVWRSYLKVYKFLSGETATLEELSVIFGPPDIVVGGLRFYRDSLSSIFIFFVRYPPSSTNGTQPTCSEISAIWKCMSEIWGIPSSYKSGAQKHFFRWFRNLTANLTACISGKIHDKHNQAAALDSLTFCQNVMNFGPQTA